jgi:hypothetical protein
MTFLDVRTCGPPHPDLLFPKRGRRAGCDKRKSLTLHNLYGWMVLIGAGKTVNAATSAGMAAF